VPQTDEDALWPRRDRSSRGAGGGADADTARHSAFFTSPDGWDGPPDREDDEAAALFPDRSNRGTLATRESTSTVSRRAVAASGLAGIALLAACNTPQVRRLREVPWLGASPTPLPTLTATTPSATSPSATMTPTSAPTSAASVPTSSPTSATTAAPTVTTTATTTTATAPPTPGPASAELLARRASYGPTAPLLDRVRTVGTGAWLAEQLDPGLADPEGDRIRAAFPSLNRSYGDLARADGGSYDLVRALQRRSLALATWSRRQLFEVLVDFWSNHLNVAVRGDDERQAYGRPDYDNSVIRGNALGRFADMLDASGMHPSMMIYLGLAGSRKEAPNENYAREILELHTVGVDGGYTEQDIKQLSLLLTGWRVAGREDGMAASYDRNRHHVGPVTVMGRQFANPSADSGPAMWTEVVDFLAHHPATARYLATKLATHFVADDPPASLVDTLASTYLASDTRIVPVVKALLESPEFAASAGGKTRRPFERFVATVRLVAPNVPGDIPDASRVLLDLLPAQSPLAWGPPDGYPDVAAAWRAPGTALDLFNAGAMLVRKQPAAAGLAGTDPVLARNPQTFTEVAIETARYLLLRDPGDAEIDATVGLLGSGRLAEPLSGGAQQQAVALAAALLLVSPDHLRR
jgi:uncharacterized protein (DUF1800 family)